MIRLEAGNLRCENIINPLGVEQHNPLLSWVLRSSLRGEEQIAYQVLVASDLDLLNADIGDYWDTGKVDSSVSSAIPYRGKPLHSMMKCYWKVRVWGRDQYPSPWSESAWWVMGVMTLREWVADWIGAITNREANFPAGRHYHLYHPPVCDDLWAKVDELAGASIQLRKEILVSPGLRQAIIYVSGLGAFELYLNGNRVSDHVLEPGWTDYEKRCYYLSYDVSEMLQAGENAVGVLLGNSMYNVIGGRYAKFRGSFGAPKMILQMALEYDDGRLEWLVSDASWKWSKSPITFNCIFGGEDYDARLEQDDWAQPGFDASQWQSARLVESPVGRLESEMIPPRRVKMEFAPINIVEPKPGVLVFDLGQNFSGRMRLEVSGSRGSSVRMLPGELLDEKGFVNQSAMISGMEGLTTEFNYTLRGKGKEIWSPSFSYSGFRYVQVEGAVLEPTPGHPLIHDLWGEFIHLDVEQVGTFECSNPVIGDIHRLIDRALLSNLQSVMTDCPHREKLGWLEQSYLVGASALYRYDLHSFFKKIVRDMRDAQLENGLVPDIAPEYVQFLDGFRDSPEWGAAYVLLPWLVYSFFGDRAILAEHFSSMLRYAYYLKSRSERHIITHGLGDWFDMGDGSFGESQLTSKGLTATAIYYQVVYTLHKIAEVLGMQFQSAELETWADGIWKAFNQRFLNPQTGVYDRGSQTAYAMALMNELVPQKLIDTASDHLLKNLSLNQFRITAGDIGHAYVLRALSKFGNDEAVYSSVNRTDEKGGYRYQLGLGATALAEAWDACPTASQNHCMLG
ncbi:MAG: family 78 glycoside hydrolase catalytic domain, partial [Anaerolineaceae bacterium]|nr:family 78 glycoside hydrolase catalytic domain [Anaerolineaceae bacterium]